MITNINTHYLDYYSEWTLALFRAKSFLDMIYVDDKANKFLNILKEFKDADLVSSKRAEEYALEVAQCTQKKYNVFFN